MRENRAQEVCDAISILVSAGVLDYNGHVSLRLDDGSFLINSGSSDRRRMTPSQLSRLAMAGPLIDGERPPNELMLHVSILNARPDVAAVVHGHPNWSTLFTTCNAKLPVVMPQGSLVADLPVYGESHSISSAERGAAVVSCLGFGPGALLRAHGSVLVGASLQEAVCRAIYLEQNAERAYRARALGGAEPLDEPTQAEYRQRLASAALYRKCWTYYLPQQGAHDVR